jgi:hypothetical protein
MLIGMFVALDWNLACYCLFIGIRHRKFEIVDNENNMILRHKRMQHEENKSIQSLNDNKLSMNRFRLDQDGGIHAGTVEGPGRYYFGIINILSEWNWKMELKRFIDVFLKLRDKDGITTLPPRPYAQRFWERAVRDVFEYVEYFLNEDVDRPSCSLACDDFDVADHYHMLHGKDNDSRHSHHTN